MPLKDSTSVAMVGQQSRFDELGNVSVGGSCVAYVDGNLAYEFPQTVLTRPSVASNTMELK